MEEQQKNIDDLFREALMSYREQPPEAAWQHVASHLDENRRRRGIYWRWIIPGLALLIALSSAGWWAIRKPVSSTQEAIVGTIHQADDATNSSSFSRNNSSSKNNKQAKTQIEVGQFHSQHTKPVKTVTVQPRVQKTLSVSIAIGANNLKQTLAHLKAIRLQPLAGLSKLPMPALQSLVVNNSYHLSWLQAVDNSEAPLPRLVQADDKGFRPANPASSPAPLAVEIPGYEQQLPQDERLNSEAMKHLEAQPDRTFAASISSASNINLQEEKLPDAATVARTTSRGLPQAETDPIPLRKPRYRESFSVSALASAGFSSALQGQYEAGLRALIQLSEHWALGIQPGISLSRLAEVKLTQAASYYRSQIDVDSFRSTEPSPSVRNALDTIYNYVVRQTLDSIVVAGMAAGGNFWEISLPVIAHYSLNEHWYAYGGPTLNFGGRIQVHSSGSTQMFTSHRHDSLAQSETLPASSFEYYFGKPTLPAYSSYKPVEIQNTPSLRLGYALGLGYTGGKFMGEINLSQQLSGFGNIPSAMQGAFSAPRVNLSVGYLLFDTRKKSTPLIK